jgi:hypothetical protein
VTFRHRQRRTQATLERWMSSFVSSVNDFQRSCFNTSIAWQYCRVDTGMRFHEKHDCLQLTQTHHSWIGSKMIHRSSSPLTPTTNWLRSLCVGYHVFWQF